MLQSAGREFAQAWARFGEAFSLLGLGTGTNQSAILALGSQSLGHIRTGHAGAEGPGAHFVSAQLDEVAVFIATLEATPRARRADLGTALLALEFLLRAAEYQLDRQSLVDECPSCGGAQLVPLAAADDISAGHQCLACGFTAAVPA